MIRPPFRLCPQVRPSIPTEYKRRKQYDTVMASQKFNGSRCKLTGEESSEPLPVRRMCKGGHESPSLQDILSSTTCKMPVAIVAHAQ
jgi:hypothetical protein